MLKEFKEFAMKGNMLDLAIGVVLGAAFGKIVDSLVGDLLKPLLGLFGQPDFSNNFVVLKAGKDGATTFATIKAAQEAGAGVLAWGNFLTAVINFVIVAFALFLVVKGVNRMRRAEPAPEPAPEVTPADVQLLTEIRDLLKK